MNIFGRKRNPPLDGALLALAAALRALAAETRENNKLIRELMIAQTTIDTTLNRLNATTADVVAALGKPAVPSTPDDSVLGLINGVEAAVASLVAVLPAPAPTAATEAAPTTA